MTAKTPTHLKLLQGTNRADRETGDTDPLVNAPLLDSLPPAPLWLPNAHATTEWYRLAPILIEMKVLTTASLAPLAQLCSVHGLIVQQYQAGLAPGASMLGTLRNLHNDFGLSPASQGKVKGQGDSGEPQKKNGFDKTGRRPSAD